MWADYHSIMLFNLITLQLGHRQLLLFWESSYFKAGVKKKRKKHPIKAAVSVVWKQKRRGSLLQLL